MLSALDIVNAQMDCYSPNILFNVFKRDNEMQNVHLNQWAFCIFELQIVFLEVLVG